jgi:hypothetical protein
LAPPPPPPPPTGRLSNAIVGDDPHSLVSWESRYFTVFSFETSQPECRDGAFFLRVTLPYNPYLDVHLRCSQPKPNLPQPKPNLQRDACVGLAQA